MAVSGSICWLCNYCKRLDIAISDKDIGNTEDDSDGVIKHRHNARKHFVQDGLSYK